MGRFSRRSFVAVFWFMITAFLAASTCKPKGPLGKYIYITNASDALTKEEKIKQASGILPTKTSELVSVILVIWSVCVSILSTCLSCRRGGVNMVTPGQEVSNNNKVNENEVEVQHSQGIKRKDTAINYVVAAFSSSLMMVGLIISGMTRQWKHFGVFNLTLVGNGTWNPSLVFVMGGGMVVSIIGYQFVDGFNYFKVRFGSMFFIITVIFLNKICSFLQQRKNAKKNSQTKYILQHPIARRKRGENFNIPNSRTIDIQLVLGVSFLHCILAVQCILLSNLCYYVEIFVKII